MNNESRIKQPIKIGADECYLCTPLESPTVAFIHYTLIHHLNGEEESEDSATCKLTTSLSFANNKCENFANNILIVTKSRNFNERVSSFINTATAHNMAMGIRLGISVSFTSTDTTDATQEITRHQTDFCFCAVIPVNLPFSWTDQWPLEHETTRRHGYRQRRSGGRRSRLLNEMKIYWSYPHEAIGRQFAVKDNGRVSFNWQPRQYGLWTKRTG